MISIEINDKELNINGHAGYDEPGKDIVCAAVSALYFTLLGYMKKKNIMHTLIQDKGVVCLKWHDDIDIDIITTGFEIIAGEYPEYVIIKESKAYDDN